MHTRTYYSVLYVVTILYTSADYTVHSPHRDYMGPIFNSMLWVKFDCKMGNNTR